MTDRKNEPRGDGADNATTGQQHAGHREQSDGRNDRPVGNPHARGRVPLLSVHEGGQSAWADRGPFNLQVADKYKTDDSLRETRRVKKQIKQLKMQF